MFIERTKKRDRADEKRESVYFPTVKGRNIVLIQTGFARATITRDIFIPGSKRPGLSRSLTNRQNTKSLQSERISFAEHWNLVAESSEFQPDAEQSA